jgi:hypothetical protein
VTRHGMATRGAVIVAILGAGCAHQAVVDRAYDARVVEGRFIEPQAYAAFLRGAIAEASGDPKEALAAYGRAESLDPGGPEIWTRIAAVRCAANPDDSRADAALAQAFAIDGEYARAWAVKGKCAFARGDELGARSAARRLAQAAPGSETSARLSFTKPTRQDAATRDTLMALTLTAPDRTIGLRALATWAETHGDVTLWAGSLILLAKIAPLQRDDIAGSAEAMAGRGAGDQARAVAGAAADASDAPPSSGEHPLAWRLAVDEAIASRDVRAVQRRATRTHLALDEVAARALLAGDIEMARDMGSTVFRADPLDEGARLVLAAVGGRDALADAARLRGHPGRVSAAAWVAFAQALAAADLVEGSRAAAGMAHEAILPGDELVVRPAVELASRGLIDRTALSADGQIELRVRYGFPIAGEGQVPLPSGVEAHPPSTVTE